MNVIGEALRGFQGFVFGRSAQEVFDERLRDGRNVSRRQIGRSEVVHDGLDAAVGRTGGGIPFKIGVRARHAEHERQMAAGRETDCPDPVRVDLKFLGIGLDEAHRGLDIVDLRGKCILGAEPILRRDRNVTVLGEFGHDRPNVGLVPRAPGSAVNDEHGRERALFRGWPGDVELELVRSYLRVNDVLLAQGLGGLIGRAHERRREEERESQTRSEHPSRGHVSDS